jgi:hypothetical protein
VSRVRLRKTIGELTDQVFDDRRFSPTISIESSRA